MDKRIENIMIKIENGGKKLIVNRRGNEMNIAIISEEPFTDSYGEYITLSIEDMVDVGEAILNLTK